MKSKFISVENLKKILEKLPDNYQICTNDISNLCVGNDKSEYSGFIDLWDGEGKLDMFEERDKKYE